MATVSYGLKIINTEHAFDETLRVYRAAVSYLMEITERHYETIRSITAYVTKDGKQVSAQQARQRYMECLVHATNKNPDVIYPRFDRDFYKFPSYLRRDAINTAIGNILSYHSQLKNWEENGKQGKKPFLNRGQREMPCFYRGNTFLQDGTMVSLKLYDGHDWIWKEITVRRTDLKYAGDRLSKWKASAPVLAKRGHRYELRIAYTIANKELPRYEEDQNVSCAVGVDLGINTDAVCVAMRKDGTVTGQKFINSPVEKDRMDGLLQTIRKAQQHGNQKPARLWRFVNNYNREISIHTATEIVSYAKVCGAKVIIFEHLEMKGKKRGRKKQRLTLWRKREIQRRVTELAAREGIRISYICARNTSRLAYDGSGKIQRGMEAGFPTNKLCRFSNGKIYNCDLSAAKNITARYYIRVLLKSVSAKELLLLQAKVPEVSRRTSCVLATLIHLSAVLRSFKAA